MTFLEAFRQAATELGWAPEKIENLVTTIGKDVLDDRVVPLGEEREYVERAKVMGIRMGCFEGGPRPDLN
jgi:hypothetical protein